MRLFDSRGIPHDVQIGGARPRASTGCTKMAASEQALSESEMRRCGDRWEVVTSPADREEVTGDLDYQAARRLLGAWRRERARQLLNGNAAPR
jgi:hypothetical protein